MVMIVMPQRIVRCSCGSGYWVIEGRVPKHFNGFPPLTFKDWPGWYAVNKEVERSRSTPKGAKQ